MFRAQHNEIALLNIILEDLISKKFSSTCPFFSNCDKCFDLFPILEKYENENNFYCPCEAMKNNILKRNHVIETIRKLLIYNDIKEKCKWR